MSVTPIRTEDSSQTPPGNGETTRVTRVFSFQHFATAVLTGIGFVGLFNGLSHMMNGAQVFAFVLALIIQGLAVMAIHHFKRARQSGGSFRILRGGWWLLLYAVLAMVTVTYSYSFYYRLMRAERAANEIYSGQIDGMLAKLAQLNSRYKSIADGFASLADSAAARAVEEEANGNTCKLASPKGPGPIRHFRKQDAQAFKEYATLVSANVTDISSRSETLRKQALGKAAQIRQTEASLNEMTEHVNASIINNPMIAGLMLFIDGRLIAADNINYFGKIIKCEDELRTSQLIALKSAAQAIVKEAPLPQVRLFDPASVQENALIAANRIGALIEWGSSLGKTELAELDPTIKGAKLSTGGKVYVAEDYLPLLFSLVIEILLFLAVPAPRDDADQHALIDAMAQGTERLSLCNVRKLIWMLASVPAEGDTMADLSDSKPLKKLTGKFVCLRPYLFNHKRTHYLVIPYTPNMERIHDFAHALVLMNHAKPILEERMVVGNLPAQTWIERLVRLLVTQREKASEPNALVPEDHFAAVHDVPVRVLVVSQEFFAWVIAWVVEMDEEELKPEPPQKRPRMAGI